MLPRLCVLSSLLIFCISGYGQESRHFTFHYAFTVKNVPVGKKLRVWVPAAQSDAFQQVKIVSSEGDLPLKKTRDSKRDNEILYAETAKAAKTELHFDVEYD